MSGALVPLPTASGTRLVKFDAAKQAIAECKSLPDIVTIKDGFAKLQALARIRDDKSLEVDVAELHKECIIQIGRVSAVLEKAPGVRTSSGRADKVKRKALRDAGISKTQAAEAEELAGGKTQQGQAAAEAAAKHAFAKARQEQKPITTKTLRKAVRETLEQTLGPAPKRVKRERPKEEPSLQWFLKFTAAIAAINEIPADILYSDMAVHSERMGGTDDDLQDVKRAIDKLERWRSVLEPMEHEVWPDDQDGLLLVDHGDARRLRRNEA